MRAAFEHERSSRSRIPGAGEAVSAATLIFVSPHGNDAASGEHPSGTINGPLLTIAAAQRRVRDIARSIASGARSPSSVHVVLLPGTYRLAETLRFNEMDSGIRGHPVVYRAAQPGTVRITGGVPLVRRRIDRSVVHFDLPPGLSVDWEAAPQLYIDDRRATLARMPDAGAYWFVQARDPQHPGRLVASDDAARKVARLSPEQRAGAILNLYQSWTTGRHRLAPDRAPNTLVPVPPPRWPFLQFGRSQRYYLENVALAWDAPGEWIGHGSTVRYRLRPGDSGDAAVAVLSVLPRLMLIAPSAPDAPVVQDLEFRGLDFEHTVYSTPGSGVVDNQAASQVGAAVEVDGAQRIVFDSCTFRHSGGHALWFRRAVSDSTISRSLFSDLGAGAIRVGVTAQGPSSQKVTTRNRVFDNVVLATGKIWPGGAGIWVGLAWNTEVSNNLVAMTSYTGISIGWKWGYGVPQSGGNVIARNLLLGIGQQQLADLGGIYTLGESPGTVIRGNVIREVRGYPEYGPEGGAGAAGIYQDEGSSAVVIEDNLIAGSDSGGYQLHYGRDNVIRSNLFAKAETAEFRVLKVKDGALSAIATNNLLIASSARPLEGLATSPHVRFASNQVSVPAVPDADLRSRCGDGCRFVRLGISTGAAARDIEISGLPDAELRTWQALIDAAGPRIPGLVEAISMDLLTPRTPPVAPVGPVTIDILGASVGDQPAGLHYRPEGDKTAIRIERRDSSAGPSQCLAFNDSKRFDHVHEPFAFLTVGPSRDDWSVQFVASLDGESVFTHEWRDAERPYRVGPSFTVAGGKIVVDGKAITTLPSGGWHTFTIATDVSTRGRVWTLEISDRRDRRQLFTDLPLRDREWRGLRWLGFVSNAATTSTACIASIVAMPYKPTTVEPVTAP